MANVERRIAEEIAAANGLSVTKLGLRFDKVVVRLLGSLRAGIDGADLKGKTVVMTITAPIKLAGKTLGELEGIIRDSLDRKSHSRDRQMTIFQNVVRLRIVDSSSRREYKFIGLVHNPGIDPKWLLDLATKWLIEAGSH